MLGKDEGAESAETEDDNVIGKKFSSGVAGKVRYILVIFSFSYFFDTKFGLMRSKKKGKLNFMFRL